MSITITEKEILSIPNDQDLGEYIRKKYWETKNETEYILDLEYDNCVICGKQTPYTKNTHILDRINYVEGAGQMCVNISNCGK
jgi:hypothetical protein